MLEEDSDGRAVYVFDQRGLEIGCGLDVGAGELVVLGDAEITPVAAEIAGCGVKLEAGFIESF